MLLVPVAGIAAAGDGAAPLPDRGECPRLQAGSGEFPDQPHAVPYMAQAAQVLHVDLTRDVAMIALPGPIGFDPRYAVSLRPDKRGGWSLTYAVDQGRVIPSRAFRATVPIQTNLAQRVARAWQQAIDRASRTPASDCIALDTASYAFSAGRNQAQIAGPTGGAAGAMIAISDTLKSIVLDTKLTGRAPHASQARLEDQLDALERVAQAGPDHVAASNGP